MAAQRHFMVHKPKGYLSQFVNNQNRRKNKKLLGELFDFPEGTMSIGRLDQNSEGLLLLTTDGIVSAQVRSKSVEKEYYAQVDGIITPEAVNAMEKGVKIGIRDQKYTTLPCKAFALSSPPDIAPPEKGERDPRHGPTSWVSITLTEGKFRQVRKMTASVGYPTLRLIRVRIGNLLLGTMAPGDVCEVGHFEF